MITTSEFMKFFRLFCTGSLTPEDIVWVKDYLAKNSTNKEFYKEVKNFGIKTLIDIYYRIGLIVDPRKLSKGDIIVMEKSLKHREVFMVDEFRDNAIFLRKTWKSNGDISFDKGRPDYSRFTVSIEMCLLPPGTFFRKPQNSELLRLKN